MRTLLTTSPEEAAAVIRRGGIVAFPTETVYGLGADATNVTAVRRIFEAKGRPADNPLIVHVSAREQIDLIARIVPLCAEKIMERFFPGALTVVLEKSDHVPAAVTAGLSTVAVRMPAARLTGQFLRACGAPVAAPSANLSGRPSPTTWEAVQADLDGRIDCLLQGPQATHGLESTVVDCTQGVPIVLRSGAVTVEALKSVLPDVRLAEDEEDLLVRSPGTRHRHYAPEARLTLIGAAAELPRSGDHVAYIGLDAPPAEAKLSHALVCASLEEYAFELYKFFRSCDARGISQIYCQRVPTHGFGRAIMDRLIRASSAQ